jgi:hypothetical protein
MNIRRGLFRLWVVLSGIFIIAASILLSGGIRDEFKKARGVKEMSSFKTLLPVDCSKVRGSVASDYSNFEGQCWYEIPKFRKLYPEYKDVDDNRLSEFLYEKAGIPLTPIRPWRKLMETVGFIVGVPLVVLLLGRSLMWAASGFRGQPAKG